MEKGTKVRVPSRYDPNSWEFGEIDHSEKRIDGKTEYHIALDTGGMTTAMANQITEMPNNG